MTFGAKRVREKIQGHHCIPANTARAAPRFRGSPIPRAKIGLPAKPQRQNPPFFMRFGSKWPLYAIYHANDLETTWTRAHDLEKGRYGLDQAVRAYDLERATAWTRPQNTRSLKNTDLELP